SAALRLVLRLLVELPHPAGEVVSDQLLGLLQETRLRLIDRHAGNPFELLELALLRLFQIVLQLLDVHLAVGDALLAARELLLAPFDPALASDHPLLDLRDPGPLLADLALGLGTDADGVLPRLDLRLAPDGLGFASGLRDARAAEELHAEHDDDACDQDAGQ